MKRSGLPACLLAASLLLLCRSARAQFDQVQLAKRYHDPLHGFSLRPPAGADKQVTASATRLVSWQVRDKQSGAIAWSLTVQQLVPKAQAGPIQVEQFAKGLKRRLDQSNTFELQDLSTGAHAGRDAMFIVGQTAGVQKFWQRQLWLLAENDRFLVFTLSGPAGLKDNLAGFASRIFQTIQVSDPKTYIKMRRENMLRGQKLLEEIDAKTLAGALSPKPLWFLLEYKGQTVGWMYQTESTGQFEGNKGFSVRSYAMVQLPDQPVRVMRRVLFSTADGEIDRWNDYLEVGEGKDRIAQAEDGLKRKDLILIDISQGETSRSSSSRGKTRSMKKRISDQALAIYLPKVHEAIIYRLIDSKSPGYVGYVFGPYNRQYGRFDMRTIAVVGTERIEIAGRDVTATRISDQKHYDVDPSTVWVDDKGHVLRITNEDGLVIEQADRPTVLQTFPRAVQTIARLSKD